MAEAALAAVGDKRAVDTMEMTAVAAKRRHQVPTAIAARSELLNGQFPLEPEQLAFMTFVRKELSDSMRRIQDYVEANMDAKHYDVGRFIAGQDELQSAKDRLCVSVILPQYAALLKQQQQQ